MGAIEAIHKAMSDDNAELFRETLSRHPELKARINDPVGPFDSPLINSVRSRAMLDTLLEAGADINARSRWWAGSFGVLDLAKEELAEYAITRGAKLDAHSAARLGKIDQLRRMLRDNPALAGARGGDGKTPLHFARTVEIAELLLQNGADVNARDVDHESAPAQHLIGERNDVVRYLVSHGSETDLFLAAALGDLELAKRLLAAAPNCIRMRVNAEHFPMKDPRAGGTIYQWTLGFNISPHEVARKFGHETILNLLLEHTPAEVRLLVSCWMGDEQTVHNLLAAEPSIATRLTPSENRELADAARNNNTRAVQLMLEVGLPVTSGGQHGGTALHWAAWHGNVEMARLLLAKRAPLEDANNDFRATPLGWAMHGSQNGWHRDTGNYPEVVRALLSAGAKLPDRTDGSDEVKGVIASWRR
jgi:ankyrin repeat protein